MADLQNTIERFAFTSQALATLGGSPEWDAALSDYLRLEALQHADDQFGDYAQYNWEDDELMLDLERRYGKNVSDHPEGAAALEARWEKVRASETQREKEFLYPMWAAGKKLALTPAPTLAAAVFKTNFIARDEVWNEKDMIDCMSVVRMDFARLQGEAANGPRDLAVG